MGLHSSPLAALFADSIESGARSKLYVWRSSLRTAGNAVGPLVSIVVFSILGDEWRVDELTYVLLGGVGAMVLPALALFAFSDRRALGAASEGLFASAAALSTAPSAALLGADATAAQVAAARSQRRACCCLDDGAHRAARRDRRFALDARQRMTISSSRSSSGRASAWSPSPSTLSTSPGRSASPSARCSRRSSRSASGGSKRACSAAASASACSVAIAYVQSAAIVLPLYLLADLADELHGGADEVGAQRLRREGQPRQVEQPRVDQLVRVVGLRGARWLADRRDRLSAHVPDHGGVQLCAAVCIAPLAFLVHAESGACGFRRPADMLPATAASTNAEPLLPGPAAAFPSPPLNQTGFTPIEPAAPNGRMPTLTTASGSEGVGAAADARRRLGVAVSPRIKYFSLSLTIRPGDASLLLRLARRGNEAQVAEREGLQAEMTMKPSMSPCSFWPSTQYAASPAAFAAISLSIVLSPPSTARIFDQPHMPHNARAPSPAIVISGRSPYTASRPAGMKMPRAAHPELLAAELLTHGPTCVISDGCSPRPSAPPR